MNSEKIYRVLDKIFLLIGIIIFIILVISFITPSCPIPDKSFNDGIVMSMLQVLKSTDECNVASIKYFNITRQLVDVDCVRELLQQNITSR